MNSIPKYQLSVVIPVGPLAGRLEATRKTVESCKGLPIQIILVCDNYNDGTKEELLEVLSQSNENTELITGQFNGPGPARNAGLTAAKAPWIAFWDADDYPNAQESLIAISNLKQFENLICNQYSIYDSSSMNEIYRSKIRKTEIENLQAIGTQPGIWRFIFARELILDMEFVNSRMGEDQEFLARVLEKKPVIQFTERNTYQYLVSRSGQLTGDRSNISQLRGISILLTTIYRSTPKKYRECVSLMLSQISLTMVINGTISTKLMAFNNVLRNPVTFMNNFMIILKEKRIRNG